MRLLFQSAEAGAWPSLYAATADIPSGSYVGPNGFMQQRGKATLVGSTKASKDEAVAKRLWDVSEELTRLRSEMTKAGVLVGGHQLHPSAKAKRLIFTNNDLRVLEPTGDGTWVASYDIWN